MLEFEIPVRTESLINSGMTWQHRIGIKARHKRATDLTWKSLSAKQRTSIDLPAVVTMTRIAPSIKMDGDGNITAFKYVRDQLARCMGFKDDNPPEITWAYAQEKAKVPRYYSVKIRIEPRAECPTCGSMVGKEMISGR